MQCPGYPPRPCSGYDPTVDTGYSHEPYGLVGCRDVGYYRVAGCNVGVGGGQFLGFPALQNCICYGRHMLSPTKHIAVFSWTSITGSRAYTAA